MSLNSVEEKERELRNQLSQLIQKEKKARNLTWMFIAVPLLVAAIWLFLSIHKVDKLEESGQVLENELKDITSSDKPIPPTADAIDRETVLSQVNDSPRRRQALAVAFDLQQKSIPFKWGGKSPEEGFDSSGYVAYVLNQVGVIQNPETYSSGRLRDRLNSKPFTDGSVEDLIKVLKPGDLLFYTNGACMFYVGGQYCLGMIPGGIYVRGIEFGLKIIAYANIRY